MKKKIFLTGFIILTVGLSYGSYEYYKFRQESHEKKLAGSYLADAAELCLKEFPAKNSHEKIRNLRHCVHINSEFKTEKELKSLWSNEDVVAGWLLGYMQKNKPKPPPMECSVRSAVLGGMLESQGFESRDIVVARNEDDFNDHVVRGVLNPDTRRWEVHDPSYDVEFVSKKNKEVLGIKRMLRAGVDEFIPCNYEGKCGWDLKTREGLNLEYNKGYWNIAWIRKIRTLLTTDNLDVNDKRSVYGENLSYCEFRAKWCKHNIEALN